MLTKRDLWYLNQLISFNVTEFIKPTSVNSNSTRVRNINLREIATKLIMFNLCELRESNNVARCIKEVNNHLQVVIVDKLQEKTGIIPNKSIISYAEYEDRTFGSIVAEYDNIDEIIKNILES